MIDPHIFLKFVEENQPIKPGEISKHFGIGARTAKARLETYKRAGVLERKEIVKDPYNPDWGVYYVYSINGKLRDHLRKEK